MASLQPNGDNARRPNSVRHPTAPTRIMNDNFASVGKEATREHYEHGCQVIDADKHFKYVICIQVFWPTMSMAIHILSACWLTRDCFGQPEFGTIPQL